LDSLVKRGESGSNIGAEMNAQGAAVAFGENLKIASGLEVSGRCRT
jgi:hypothetical protein